MLINNHPDIPRKGKLVKITLHLDSVIADYLKKYAKEQRLTMSYIIEALIGSSEEFKEVYNNGNEK